METLAAETRARYRNKPAGEIAAVKAVRAIFHRTGVDPTRYRPSSEALLRRVLKGQGLYSINSAVDLVNYFSLRTLLPMGVYDAGRIAGPVTLRAGRQGETYVGVGRTALNLAGFPLLADETGPFGSAISDSIRTQVTAETTSLLWVTYSPDLPIPDFEEFAARMMHFNGGAVKGPIPS